MTKNFLAGAMLIAGLISAPVVLACDGAGPASHIGKVVSVDPAGKKFTITDVQTRGPITFVASDEIITGVKDAKGMVTVKYEEKNGGLEAVGVTF